MKKPLLLLLFNLLLSAPALCQQWRVAPTVGMNVSTILYSSRLRNALQSIAGSSSVDFSTGSIIRPLFGAYIDRSFSDRLSIRSGLLYSGKGGSMKFTSTINSSVSAQSRIQFGYLEVPLLLTVAVGENGLRLIGGPVLGLTLSGKSVLSSTNTASSLTDEPTKLQIGSNPSDDLMPTDISLNLGLAKQLELGDDLLELGLHVQPSLSRWTPPSRINPDSFARNLLVGLRVSYLFEVGR